MAVMLDRVDVPWILYPTMTRAAGILGVSKATLSRRNVPAEAAGGRDKRVRPDTVMREAAYHRRRRLPDVAADLVAHAHEIAAGLRDGPTLVEAVRREVDSALERHSVPAGRTVPELLDALREGLPGPLYRRVASIIAAAGELPAFAGSVIPDDLAAELAADEAGDLSEELGRAAGTTDR